MFENGKWNTPTMVSTRLSRGSCAGAICGQVRGPLCFFLFPLVFCWLVKNVGPAPSLKKKVLDHMYESTCVIGGVLDRACRHTTAPPRGAGTGAACTCP